MKGETLEAEETFLRLCSKCGVPGLREQGLQVPCLTDPSPWGPQSLLLWSDAKNVSRAEHTTDFQVWLWGEHERETWTSKHLLILKDK